MKQIFECDAYSMPPTPSGSQPMQPTVNSIPPPATSWADISIVTKSTMHRTPLNQLNVNSNLEATPSFFKNSKMKISKERRCKIVYTRKTLTFIEKVSNEVKVQDHDRMVIDD